MREAGLLTCILCSRSFVTVAVRCVVRGSLGGFSIRSDVGRAACGKFGLWVVEVQVVLLELAFCAGFVIVGIENVQQVLGGNRW